MFFPALIDATITSGITGLQCCSRQKYEKQALITCKYVHLYKKGTSSDESPTDVSGKDWLERLQLQLLTMYSRETLPGTSALNEALIFFLQNYFKGI